MSQDEITERDSVAELESSQAKGLYALEYNNEIQKTKKLFSAVLSVLYDLAERYSRFRWSVAEKKKETNQRNLGGKK